MVSMESAREHPCQGLADLMTIEENFGLTSGLPVALTWAPHIKPLPKAVPNSFLSPRRRAVATFVSRIRKVSNCIRKFVREAEALAQATAAAKFPTFVEQDSALKGARAIYAKSWGPATASGLSTRMRDSNTAIG